MALLLILVIRLCLKSLVQLSNDDWMTLSAILFVAIALRISHKVHMLTGR